MQTKVVSYKLCTQKLSQLWRNFAIFFSFFISIIFCLIVFIHCIYFHYLMGNFHLFLLLLLYILYSIKYSWLEDYTVCVRFSNLSQLPEGNWACSVFVLFICRILDSIIMDLNSIVTAQQQPQPQQQNNHNCSWVETK